MNYLRSTKVVMAFLLLIFAIILVALGEVEGSAYLFIASLIVLMAHFFFGEVIAAYKNLGLRKFDKAERLLDSTFSPGLLFKMHRSYYYLSRSILYSKNGDYILSEEYLKQSTEVGGLRDRDKVMAWINLAYLFLSKGQMAKAKVYFKNTQSVVVKDLRVKSELEKLEKAIHSR